MNIIQFSAKSPSTHEKKKRRIPKDVLTELYIFLRTRFEVRTLRIAGRLGDLEPGRSKFEAVFCGPLTGPSLISVF